MGVELLRIAAEQGLIVAGRAGARPGWRTTCQRCAGWLELPARPPASPVPGVGGRRPPTPASPAREASPGGPRTPPAQIEPDPIAEPEAVWWVRRICAFATRHRHPRRPAGVAVPARAVR
jgi:hypothetical protein